MKTLTDFRKTVETAVWHDSRLGPEKLLVLKVELQIVFDRP